MEAHATIREVVLVGVSSGYRCGEMVCQISFKDFTALFFHLFFLGVLRVFFSRGGGNFFIPIILRPENNNRIYLDFMC